MRYEAAPAPFLDEVMNSQAVMSAVSQIAQRIHGAAVTNCSSSRLASKKQFAEISVDIEPLVIAGMPRMAAFVVNHAPYARVLEFGNAKLRITAQHPMTRAGAGFQ